MIAPRPLRALVVFSGSASPGMNAFLYNVVRLGLNRHRAEILGVKDGYAGLVRTVHRLIAGELPLETIISEIDTHEGLLGVGREGQDLVRLDHASVRGLLERAGTMLNSSRCPEFHDAAVRRQVVKLLEGLGAHAVMVCGGNGSLAGADCLANESGLRVVGIPATVENDVPMTEMALGVDTAMNTLACAVARFADAAVSHRRIMVLEVMGRNRGQVARMAALASGAEIVVTPESGNLTADNIQEIARWLERAMLRGRRHAIVLVAEGVSLDPALTRHGGANSTLRLARDLQDYFSGERSPFPDLEARACVLGHLQRGGPPSVADRILAARFAEAAWEVISRARERSGVLGLRNGEIVLQDFEGWIDPEQTEAARRFCQLHRDMSNV